MSKKEWINGLIKELINGFKSIIQQSIHPVIRQSKLTTVFTVAVICLGCSPHGAARPVAGEPAKIGTSEGMIEYLKGQDLPAVRSVERWPNEYGDGLAITTEHYLIYTTLLDPLMLAQIPSFVESAYRGYQSQLPEYVSSVNRFTVYLFSDRQQWDDFTAVFAGRQAEMFGKIKVGAYYLNGSCVAYNIGRERTFSAIGHEGWHQFSSILFKFRLPSWLDEGVAMLFESGRYDGGLFYFDPKDNLYRLSALKRTLQQGGMMAIKDLVAANPGDVLAADDDAVAAFYSQSYAMVRFLREDAAGIRLDGYRRLLIDGLKGNWPIGLQERAIAADRNIPLTVGWNETVGPQLFRLYIGEDLKQIEGQYLSFCRKIVYHIRD